MKIGVCGLGLIGGSICLRLRQKGFDVVGSTRNEKARVEARRRRLKLVGREGIRNCDVIFLAGRMRQIPEDIKFFGKSPLLVDVASLKVEIVRSARKYAARYISAHPIAGNEKSGMENADPSLFEGAPFLVLPVKCSAADIRFVSKVARALGAKPIRIRSAQQHDRWFADSIGLPHSAAYAIRHLCKRVPDFMKGPSYRSATRVSNSDVEFVTQMLSMNRPALGKELRELCRVLKRLETSLKSPSATRRLLQNFSI